MPISIPEAPVRPGYRDLLRTPEFTPLFLAGSAQTAAQTVAGLGLATLVFDATGSPLLSALAMFGPSLAQLLGATTLLSAADRLPPRTALAVVAVVFAAGTAVQAAPGVPLAAAFGLLAVLGVVGSLGGGVRLGLLGEILPPERFLLGRAVMNMAVGVCQIAGFATGGVLLVVLSPRGTLLTGAALYLLAALLYRFGLTARPPRASGRASAAETWRANGRLLADRNRRLLYLALWVPNGLIVGCEALFVSYDPDRAGLLFACAAVGMLAGDTVVGRFVPARLRGRLAAPLQALLAAPYLLFALGTGLPPILAAAAVAVSAAGYGASLLYQERLLPLVPEEARGHALGLHGSGMLACQGLAAALAGGLAQLTSPATAMALLAAASLAVTAALTAALTAGRSSAARPSPRTARRRTA
ncbi:MFS transporter [Streptomyces sp. R302]|uniref:MFS transporter n=1 Tax=unclassified Streptomyces TaxID=2593676 RepID=UPI00145F5CA9|nr:MULTISPECIES: MFS transporter [unclassified Streptomyces]NML51288.1 MFS transporter [Streptomyces sp. R301]NML79866.1 MFS transporter [Streptomyces sp. R302]